MAGTKVDVEGVLRKAVGGGTPDLITALYGGVLLGKLGLAEDASYWEQVSGVEKLIQSGEIKTLEDLYKILITEPGK